MKCGALTGLLVETFANLNCVIYAQKLEWIYRRPGSHHCFHNLSLPPLTFEKKYLLLITYILNTLLL